MSAQPRATKPTVRMTDDEAWHMLEQSRVGILTTLRRDGRPVALPVWYAVLDRRIYVQTRGRKVERVAHDARSSVLVEAGERWAELQAVHADCHASIIDPSPELRERFGAAMDAKYRAYRSTRGEMPSTTRDYYRQASGAMIELVPVGKLLTWDNRKLRGGERRDRSAPGPTPPAASP